MATTAAAPIAEAGDEVTPVAPPSRRARLLAALAIGAVSALVTYAFHSRAGAAPDFIYPWTAARALLDGLNPYAALPGGQPAPFQAPLLYPLTAVLVTAPVAWLSLAFAVALFMGISAGLLAYALTREGWGGMVIFASAPFIFAVALGQWSPLLTAAALLPAFGFLQAAKPNLGLALLVYRPSRTALIGCALFVALSLLVLPTWPRDWLHSLSLDRQSGTHLAPIATPIGFILALALLRWRRPETRLLLAMACVPQLLLFYDQLPLMLIAETRKEREVLALTSGVVAGGWLFWGHGTPAEASVAEWCVMLGIYLPCLVMVLRRPNEGRLPEWLARQAARMRATPQSIR